MKDSYQLSKIHIARYLNFFTFTMSIGAGILIGCATSSASRGELTAEETQKVREYEAELDVGRNMAGRLLQHFKPLENREVTEYVNTVGQLVVKNSPFSERQFVFGIIDTSAVNAFAVPGGYVLVTRGTLEKIESEAELAAILGHEIAHVGKKHIYDALIQKAKQRNQTVTAPGGPSISEPESVTVRKRPDSESNETADTLAKYIGGSVGGQFNVLSAIRGGISVLLEEGIDPALESEADLEGLQYAMAAGYEPRALRTYFERVLSQKNNLDLKVLNKTHPSFETRISKISEYLETSVPKEYAGALGQERLEKKLKGI